MLNNCEIRYTIARDKWFYRIGNVIIHRQQIANKVYEKSVESDSSVSVSITKGSGWWGLQISLHGSKQSTKDGSDLREIIVTDSGATTNLFGNLKMITNILKSETLMNFITNAGSKIVDGVG